MPGQPSLSKGAAALKPACGGSEAALGLFMASAGKRTERQAKGKNKSESRGLARTSSKAGSDLGASLLVLPQAAQRAARRSPPPDPGFSAVCRPLAKDKRKAGERASVTRLDSCRERGRPGQRDGCAREQIPGVQTAESLWDPKPCISQESTGNKEQVGKEEQSPTRGYSLSKFRGERAVLLSCAPPKPHLKLAPEPLSAVG